MEFKDGKTVELRITIKIKTNTGLKVTIKGGDAYALNLLIVKNK